MNKIFPRFSEAGTLTGPPRSHSWVISLPHTWEREKTYDYLSSQNCSIPSMPSCFSPVTCANNQVQVLDSVLSSKSDRRASACDWHRHSNLKQPWTCLLHWLSVQRRPPGMQPKDMKTARLIFASFVLLVLSRAEQLPLVIWEEIWGTAPNGSPDEDLVIPHTCRRLSASWTHLKPTVTLASLWKDHLIDDTKGPRGSGSFSILLWHYRKSLFISCRV